MPLELLTRVEPGALFDLQQAVELSSADIYQQVAQRALALQAQGLQTYDRVLLTHANSWQFLCDLLALWQIGACAVPVDPTQSLPEVLNLSRHAQAKALIYREPYALLERLQSETEILCIDSDNLLFELSSANIIPSARTIQPDDLALLLYTSGSTGEPKGVMHSFASLQARLDLLKDHVLLERLQRTLNLLPTHFGHGLICNCLYPWLNGQSLYMLPAFNLESLSKLGKIIDEHQISFMSSVPSLWRLALRLSKPPQGKSLQQIHCGSALLSTDLRSQIQTWAGIQNVRNTYGITETGSWLAGTPDDLTSFHDGYIGPVWGGQLKICNEQRQALPQGEVGMVWHCSQAVMLGYYQRPDLSAEVLDDGWFKTGDLGYVDTDQALTLVGRERHEINKGGLKVYPEDIDLLLERHPQITEACAFAIEDPIAGQNIAAAIVTTDGFDLDALRNWLQDHLSPHKQPVRWFIVDKIPRTSRGKINREAVAKSLVEFGA